MANNRRKKMESRLRRQHVREQEQQSGHGAPDPAVAVCMYDASVSVSADLIRMVWAALRGGAVVPTRPAQEMGEERRCWHNVGRLVQTRGGELVLGWSVCDEPLRNEIPPQRNRFARTALNSHAVWLHAGVYYETCPERLSKGMQFLPTGEAAVMCDAVIEFFDREWDARSVSWPAVSFAFRPLKGVLVRLATSSGTGTFVPAPAG